MKRIAEVDIENFQSHERSLLTFGAGLNVILGPSDNGKSAVLRALRWALYNEPRGTEFVRVGSRECRVTVTMDDGVRIVRELLLTKSGGAARNRYVVHAPEREPQVFEGFGTDVPHEVTKAHGMPQVLLDTDKRVGLSFGSQLEGPFLMTESGSFRARAIGRLLGVHVVDAAVRNTQRDMKGVKAEVGRLEREVERFNSELQPYADIPAQESALTRAEALLAQAEAMQGRMQQLETIRTQIDRTEMESLAVGRQLAQLRGVDEAEKLVLHAADRHRDCTRLERFDAELRRITVEMQHSKVRIDALLALPIAEQGAREAASLQARLDSLVRIHHDLSEKNAEMTRAERQVSRLAEVPRVEAITKAVAERLDRLERVQDRAAQWADAEQRMAKGAAFLHQTEAELSSSLAEYEQLLRQLGKCPTCMQPVEPTAVRRILAELEATTHRHD